VNQPTAIDRPSLRSMAQRHGVFQFDRPTHISRLNQFDARFADSMPRQEHSNRSGPGAISDWLDVVGEPGLRHAPMLPSLSLNVTFNS
jgi:hypothetical protein